MYRMFEGLPLMKDFKIENWDVSNVVNMNRMFAKSSLFNTNLTKWNVSSLVDAGSMFYGASSFNYALGSWDIAAVEDLSHFLNGSGISIVNYDRTLIGWSKQSLKNGVELTVNSQYCASQSERQSIIDDFNWIIYDDGKKPGFCTGIKTKSTPSNSEDEAFTANIILYPNPVKDKITVNNENGSVGLLNMFSREGRIILSKKYNSDQLKFEVDVSGLIEGTYSIHFEENGKVIKKSQIIIN